MDFNFGTLSQLFWDNWTENRRVRILIRRQTFKHVTPSPGTPAFTGDAIFTGIHLDLWIFPAYDILPFLAVGSGAVPFSYQNRLKTCSRNKRFWAN